jgi:hypothetical protein
MVLSPGLVQLCSELDQFRIATAIGHVSKDVFVGWNRSFEERLAMGAEGMRKVELRNIVEPHRPVVETATGHGAPTPFIDCVIRIPGDSRQILGRSVRRDDGFILVILDPVSGNRGIDEYARGYLIGRKTEKERSQQILHDNVSGNLLAASFAAESARQKLEDEGRPEVEDLNRVTSLIDQAITNLVDAFTSGPSILNEE